MFGKKNGVYLFCSYSKDCKGDKFNGSSNLMKSKTWMMAAWRITSSLFTMVVNITKHSISTCNSSAKQFIAKKRRLENYVAPEMLSGKS